MSSLVLILIVFLFSVAYPLYNGSSEFLLQFLKTYLHFLYLVIFGLIFIVIRVTTYEIKTIIKTFLYTSIPIHIFGIYQLFARVFDLPFAFIEYNNIIFTLEDQYGVADGVSQLSLRFENFYRATSIFSEPSALATYSCLILSFLLVPYFNKTSLFIKNKYVFLLAVYLALANLFLAFSNTGLLTFFLMLMMLIFIDKKLKIKTLLKNLFVFIIFFIIIDSIISIYTDISVLGLFAERLEGILYYLGGDSNKLIVGESFETRSDNFRWMIDIWTEHPISGIGLGLIKLNGIHPVKFSDFFVAGALAETGIQGVIAFTLFFVFLWKISFLITKKYNQNKLISEDDKSIYSVLIYIVLVITVINWITANQFVSESTWIFSSIAFAIISKYYYINNFPFIELKVVSVPLKTTFNNNLNHYFNKR